jgi:hypothetical protein
MTAMSVQTANASSLFYDKCEQQSSFLLQEQQPIVLVSTSSGLAGMSCQDIKSAFRAAKIIGAVLMPVSLALRTPGVREEIGADLASLGLTLANPAVLGVTVLGGFGVVTVYLIMKHSLEECESFERQQFKQELLQQLKQSYPGSNGSDIPLEIRKEGRAA